jgi:hypothetical protein
MYFCLLKIFFQAVVGASSRASVGIDDVRMMSERCTFHPEIAKPKDVIIDGNIFNRCCL